MQNLSDVSGAEYQNLAPNGESPLAQYLTFS